MLGQYMEDKTDVQTRVNAALGASEAFLSFQERLAAVAKVDRPVMIVGERGSGKELAAVRLHYHSHRWQGPLVTVNCAALSENLLESALFGHEPGAFTGAVRLHRGLFEAAHAGTLFLDEISSMSARMQEKVLRVVEYQVLQRLGASRSLEVDVRIISATNADLRRMAVEGRFKADLLDRLSFEVLHVPPLRKREGDVALLAGHFAAQMAVTLGRTEAPRFGASALRMLESYPWPGNVRELKNVVERAVFRAGKSTVVREVVFDPFAAKGGDDPAEVATVSSRRQSRNSGEAQGRDGSDASRFDVNGEADDLAPLRGTASTEIQSLPEALANEERRHLARALHQARFNQREAARLLGLTYHQFRGLYRKHKQALNSP